MGLMETDAASVLYIRVWEEIDNMIMDGALTWILLFLLILLLLSLPNNFNQYCAHATIEQYSM